MSNYRVRQVLALGAMPDRQLRFLVALATWMTDDTRTVRVGFDSLIGDTGNSHNTVRNARRELEAARKLASVIGRGQGNLTVWTVLCLPATAGKGTSEVDPLSAESKGTSEVDPLSAESKGTSEVDPLRPVDNSPKGTNRGSQKVPTGALKRYQPESADLREPDRGLNRRANPSGFSLSARAREAILAAVPDATETEIEAFAAEIEKDHNPGNLGAYITGFPAGQITDTISRMRAGQPYRRQTRQEKTDDQFARAMERIQVRTAAEMLQEIDADTTRDEAAEVLAIIRQRPAVRDAKAVLHAEIARGNGYNLLMQARHQMDRAQAGKWDPPWETPQAAPPAQVISGEVVPADDREPADLGALLAPVKAKLGELNGHAHADVRPTGAPETRTSVPPAETP